MKRFILYVVVASLYTSSCLAAPEWNSANENWCVVEGGNKICLPTSFKVVSIGKEYVSFAQPPHDVDPRIFVDFFVLGSCGLSEADIPGPGYVLKDNYQLGEIAVSIFTADPRFVKQLSAETYVLSLKKHFAFQIIGEPTDELLSLVTSITDQWNANSAGVTHPTSP